MIKTADINYLTGIKWAQYTPYFNDGEACVFGIHGVYYQIDGAEEGGDDDDGWCETYWYGDDKPPAFAADLKAFEKAINEIGDGMERIFGDHVEVTCTRESIEVNEYSHD